MPAPVAVPRGREPGARASLLEAGLHLYSMPANLLASHHVF